MTPEIINSGSTLPTFRECRDSENSVDYTLGYDTDTDRVSLTIKNIGEGDSVPKTIYFSEPNEFFSWAVGKYGNNYKNIFGDFYIGRATDDYAAFRFCRCSLWGKEALDGFVRISTDEWDTYDGKNWIRYTLKYNPDYDYVIFETYVQSSQKTFYEATDSARSFFSKKTLLEWAKDESLYFDDLLEKSNPAAEQFAQEIDEYIEDPQ